MDNFKDKSAHFLEYLSLKENEIDSTEEVFLLQEKYDELVSAFFFNKYRFEKPSNAEIISDVLYAYVKSSFDWYSKCLISKEKLLSVCDICTTVHIMTFKSEDNYAIDGRLFTRFYDIGEIFLKIDCLNNYISMHEALYKHVEHSCSHQSNDWKYYAVTLDLYSGYKKLERKDKIQLLLEKTFAIYLYAQSPYLNDIFELLGNFYQEENKEKEYKKLVVVRDEFLSDKNMSKKLRKKEEGEFCGFIDNEGNKVSQFNYTDVGAFREGFAWVCKGVGKRYGFKKLKFGYINEDGIEVIPLLYEDARPFFQGVALVYLNDEPFYINKNGEKVEYNLLGI